MRNCLKNMFVGALFILLLWSLAACGNSTLPEEEKARDKPTIPENVAEGIDYLYDFHFSQRYDDRVTDDFSLILPDEVKPIGDKLFLLEKYQNKLEAAQQYLYDGDGMVPHMIKKYWFTFEKGSLMVGTDYYKPDQVEYISYLWSDIDGVRTNKNVEVSSAEGDLLLAYTQDLYYLPKEEASSEMGLEDIDGKDDFDYAYMWQPFTPETNEIRDIVFYMKDSHVVSIEITEPYELRHVYGYDREAGLQQAETQRKKAEEVSRLLSSQKQAPE